MKYKVNSNAFKEYSQESAYWAGFIAADGCVDKKNRLRIYLGIKDLEHLYKFKRFLKAEHKVSESKTYARCSFELTNKVLVSDLLINYSITPNKSLTLKFPEQLPDAYVMSFIRGYWDGDGTLCESFSNKNSVTASFYASVVGSEDFILHLAVLIEEKLNKQLPAIRTHTNGINATWKLNTVAAMELAKLMYENSTYETRLNRKYEIFKTVVLNNNRKLRNI